ncbi:MAG: response regulator, partial [Myxococcota bacterium]
MSEAKRSGQRVLYVDDDEANLLVFRAAFAGELDVVTAGSGPEGLAILRRDPDAALLVTDQRMPGMSGTQLSEIVRREHPGVIRYLITAYSDLAAAIDAINLGEVHRYLRKPWDAAELRVQLREGLEVHALRARVRDLEGRMRDVERVYALGVVAASIVHELRNPLSVVIGYADLARNSLDSLEGADPVAIDDFERILTGTFHAATRMAEIARAVELTTRRQPGAQRSDLGEVVELTLKMVSNDLRHRATMTKSIEHSLIVGVSATPLSQVALNLLINAVQALAPSLSEAAARVEITARRDGVRA